jgi:hypothetical protein
VHVVVAAGAGARGAYHPNEIREQFKAWCTRRLKALERERERRQQQQSQQERTVSTSVVTGSRRDRNRNTAQPVREKWWAERGSGLYINDEESLEAVIHYVREAQDQDPRREVRS